MKRILQQNGNYNVPKHYLILNSLFIIKASQTSSLGHFIATIDVGSAVNTHSILPNIVGISETEYGSVQNYDKKKVRKTLLLRTIFLNRFNRFGRPNSAPLPVKQASCTDPRTKTKSSKKSSTGSEYI